MRKETVSNGKLAYILLERLREIGDCSPTLSIAIVPSEDSWEVVTNRLALIKNPMCAKSIEQVQAELRRKYTLAKD
jgi:hypothetical protein